MSRTLPRRSAEPLTLMLLAALSVAALVANLPVIPLRVVASIPTLLFSPGYLILLTGFPSSANMKRSERFLLSVGLSLAIIGVWAVILSALLLPLTPLIVGAPPLAATFIFGAIRLWRLSAHS